DAGEDDFAGSAVELARDRVADGSEGKGSARSPRLPDRAEGAAMVAAGLDGDEAAYPLAEAGGDGGSGFESWSHNRCQPQPPARPERSRRAFVKCWRRAPFDFGRFATSAQDERALEALGAIAED